MTAALVPSCSTGRHGSSILAPTIGCDSPAVYAAWYGEKHGDPERLATAVYGLPELFREQISRRQLIANPGCYPTSAILALAPLLKAGLIEPSDIIIDSKSGVSGAGRTPKLTHSFPGMQRKPLGLQRRPPSAHAGDRADPRARPAASDDQRDFHAASDADGPRHSHRRPIPVPSSR